LNLILKYLIELLLSALLGFTLMVKPLNQPYNRPIAGDGEGYYAYLPALFIYHDGRYSFAKDIETKYYSEGRFSMFVSDETGNVNKYFPGAALLWSPFFALAHFTTWVTGGSTDGYSDYYQLFVILAAYFYLWLACKLLLRILLLLNISLSSARLSVLFTLLSGFLVYNIVFIPSLIHLYNFFLINLFVWLLLKCRQTGHLRYFHLAILTGAIATIARPSNAIVYLLIPVFIKKEIIQQLLKSRCILLTMLATAVVFTIPLLLYEWQSGSFFRYSYGNETFHFTHPEILNTLFSYRRGFFVYSPIMLISMAGWYFLFKSKQDYALKLMLFYALVIYIVSSWWCWWYGLSYGQRAFADFYFINAVLLGILFDYFHKNRSALVPLIIVCTLTVPINLIQTYQHYCNILEVDNITAKEYWSKFLRLDIKP
jgi:hypothetical protein